MTPAEYEMTDLKASSLRALKLMDLTTLNDDDTNEKVIALCHQAKTPVGNTAAVCIYPRFIPIARKTLNEQGTPDIRIATVTNFGGFGLTFAAPMPMPSESIILGVGAVTKTPVWSDEVEAFIPISKANIVATGDHRVVDGADIGRLLKRVAELLQRPEYL